MFNIGHPAHVHMFKNLMWELEKKGHEIMITARSKDVTIDLLRAYNFDFYVVGDNKTTIVDKLLNYLKIVNRMYKVARKFNPDILIGASGDLYVAQVSKLLKKPSIIFEDTELETTVKWFFEPFVTTICTPNSFEKNLNPKKHVKYNGYKELAYLHPNYFVPDPSVLEMLNLSQGDEFILLRFVAWEAGHDLGHRGISLEMKEKIIDNLVKEYKVFISSESELPQKLERYKIRIPPHMIHDVIYYAKMLIGDSQTMTTEAGILGTPAIRCNSFVGERDMSNFIELEEKYRLIYSFKDNHKALKKALELLKNKDINDLWLKKRSKLLNEKEDVTKFMVNLVEEFGG